jgi:hypothetical protein
MTAHPSVTEHARMSTPCRAGRKQLAQPPTALVDEMLARYIAWREEAAVVADVLRRWREAPAGDAAVWRSACGAALDQEESAAISYELAVWDVERWLQRAEERSGQEHRGPVFAANGAGIGADGGYRAVTPSNASRH